MHQTLVKLISQGKENEAREKIYISCSEAVIAFLKRYSWCNGIERDILHDAIEICITKIKEGKVPNFKCGYIIKVSEYIALNEKKKIDKLTHLHLNEIQKLTNEIEAFYGKTEIDLEHLFGESSINFEGKIVLAAFKLLEDNCKKIISLKRIENMSHEEIVQELENITTAASSRQILKRCMQRWRKKIEELKK